MRCVAPYMEFDDAGVNEDFSVERDHYEGWEKYNAIHWRCDLPDFVRFFMREVFSESDSEQTIDELVAIALDASPEILVEQETEQN